jgi:hypothetical protein
VTDGAPTQVELALDASAYKRVQHKNKFGKDYSAAEDKY